MYWWGIIFTMGFIMAADEDGEDTWGRVFAMLFLSLAFPLFWGIYLGSTNKKGAKDE